MNRKSSLQSSEQGIAHIGIILILIVLAIAGFAGWRVLNGGKSKSTTPDSPASSGGSGLVWQQAEGGWRSMSTVPDCPAQPMMKLPADISKVTSVLYPGQTRGGNYKPHGGFRFDNSPNADIKVTAPIDGYIVRGGTYLAEGEVQYTFDVMNNCGVMIRVGHLRVLPDDLQKLADTWPAPKEGDSRTQEVSPVIYVKQGDVLATTVGLIGTKNTFFDWGIYDYRKSNEASKSSAYQQAHADDEELSWHAVCWLKDWIASGDGATLLSLPAGDPTSGSNSDYCK